MPEDPGPPLPRPSNLEEIRPYAAQRLKIRKYQAALKAAEKEAKRQAARELAIDRERAV